MTTDDTEYQVQCPVCHNKSTVYHNAWATVTCRANDCGAHVPNPRPDKDNELSVVEQAETDLHNAHLTVARTKRILGNHKSPLDVIESVADEHGVPIDGDEAWELECALDGEKPYKKE